MNKKYEKALFVIVILLIGLAFLPLITDTFAKSYSWEEFAAAYRNFKVFIPLAFKSFAP
jgi:hypothetical protein